MSRQTRRTFLKTAAAATAGTFAANFAIAGANHRILGANETIHVAVAGIRGRGSSHIDAFAGMNHVQVTYLVDPDMRTWKERVKQVERKGKNTPKCVKDIREALQDKDLDVVSIATCNHWHSLMTIWACQAGKDVYVEKPCSHNVFEGRKCVEAAEKYGRIVQHGTQSRGSSSWARQVAAIAGGKYGKLLVSKGYASKIRWTIGFKPVEEPPADLDFDLWLGPAPKQPYHGNLVPYNWHWFWDTGNGEIGNQGVHQMDIARWAIPGGTLPTSVISFGGRWVDEPDYKDQGQTPNMQMAVMDFGGTLLVFEVCGLNNKKDPRGTKVFSPKVDNEFYLEEGVIRGGKFFPKGKDKAEPLVEAKDPHAKRGEQFANFVECVRSRKREDLNADVLEAHLSSACCHLPNISHRLGREVSFDEARRELGDVPQVQDSLRTIEEYLEGALGIDTKKITGRLGAKLTFDPKAEKFIGNPAADELLTRKPRKPFDVPEKV